MSVSVLGIFLAFAYAAMLVSNRQAMVHRLYTLAEEMARDRIDRVLASSPFNPQFTPAQIPADLMITGPTPVPVTVPLYTDPGTGEVMLNAQITTVIADTGSLNTYSALVTVSYTFAGRNFTVQMNTLRTSDS